MNKLLKKEFALAMHPVTPFMLLLAAMVLIPNYPYSVSFFYVTLGVFFTCLQGRENNDIVYSMNLPVAKKSLVSARFIMVIILEAIQGLIMAPLIWLSASIYPDGNAAGLDASPALYGMGLIIFGLFHLCFFIPHYRSIKKVGLPFVFSCVMLFTVVILEIIATYAVPFVRDYLDTPGFEAMPQKLMFIGAALIFYIISTLIAHRSAVKSFTSQDL